MNYGYINEPLAKQMIKKIVSCLGGGNNAEKLILETAKVETGLGTLKDRTRLAGMGLTQFDNKPFYDIKNRSKRFKNKIKNELGIDISMVHWEHLRYNPFLSFLFTRLFYLTIREKIPNTLKERAKYWKKYYNTYLGKGTIEHYIESNQESIKQNNKSSY